MHSHPSPKFSVITVTYNAEKVLEDTWSCVGSPAYYSRDEQTCPSDAGRNGIGEWIWEMQLLTKKGSDIMIRSV